jgi:hypothetical protein
MQPGTRGIPPQACGFFSGHNVKNFQSAGNYYLPSPFDTLTNFFIFKHVENGTAGAIQKSRRSGAQWGPFE